MHLDVELIRRRRRELRLTQRAVARQLGVSPVTMTRLEEGAQYDDLPLRLLGRLADILAVDAADLLRGSDSKPDESGDDLVRRAGALLAAAVGSPVATATLADALGTTAAAARTALDGVDAALRPAGLRLYRGSDGAAIVDDAAAADCDQLQRLLRGQHARHGLTALDATLLAKAAAGTLDPAKLGHAEQVSLARLCNAGLVDTDGDVSDDVRYSLGMTP